MKECFKFVIIGIFFASIAVQAGADKMSKAIKYRALPLEEKMAGDDMTFCLTFEPLATTANKAGGKAGSTTFTEDLGLRGVLGFDKLNAFNLQQGEVLKYAVKDNIDHRQGTALFWAKALDYDPAVKPGKPHKSYLYFYFEDRNSDKWIKMYLYQFMNSSRIMFYWQNSEAPHDRTGWKVAVIEGLKIRQGEWFMVGATWDKKSIN